MYKINNTTFSLFLFTFTFICLFLIIVDAVMPEVLEGKDKISLEDFLVWTVGSPLAQVLF